MRDESQNNFRINSFNWNLANEECKEVFKEIVNDETKDVSELCLMYFEKFYILHKIGHIIMHKYDVDHHIQEARTEFCANLFAYKYLELKGEKKYLSVLTATIQNILHIHKAFFEFEIEKMNSLFSRYKLDLLTYIAFHFNCYNKCLNNEHEFLEIIQKMSKGKLSKINTSVIFQKGLSGVELINECLTTVFELNDDIPNIELKYCDNLSVGNINLELL
jgi:hypothetical protein